MSAARTTLSRWLASALIPPDRMREALAAVGATRSPGAWRTFLDRTLLWAGAVAIAAALSFFIAANWQAMGRFGKLALVEAAIVLAIVTAIWRGIDSLPGRAALLAASLGVGTLLALVGQTYQTGADTYELFVAWALAILAWVAVARQPALWILWIAIVDLAVCLYADAGAGRFVMALGIRGAVWTLFLVHLAALLVWEWQASRRVRWLDVRWAPRLVALGAIGAMTGLLIEAMLLDSMATSAATAAVLGYGAMMAGLFYAYRLHRVDRFMLASGILSVIAVAVALSVRWHLLEMSFGFLAIGLVIITLAGFGAQWLRSVQPAGRIG